MTLQWLGQVSFALEAGQMYRGRWLLPCAPGCDNQPPFPTGPCPLDNAELDAVRAAILGSLPSVWRDVVVLQDSLPRGPRSTLPTDWPTDRMGMPAAQNPNQMCVVFTEAVAAQSASLPSNVLLDMLRPAGGLLVNFWNQSNGQRLVDDPNYNCGGGMFWNPITKQCQAEAAPPTLPPPHIPGGQAPPGPPLPPPPGPVTPTPGTAEKKTSPLVWVLGGAVLIGAVWLIVGD